MGQEAGNKVIGGRAEAGIKIVGHAATRNFQVGNMADEVLRIDGKIHGGSTQIPPDAFGND